MTIASFYDRPNLPVDEIKKIPTFCGELTLDIIASTTEVVKVKILRGSPFTESYGIHPKKSVIYHLDVPKSAEPCIFATLSFDKPVIIVREEKTETSDSTILRVTSCTKDFFGIASYTHLHITHSPKSMIDTRQLVKDLFKLL